MPGVYEPRPEDTVYFPPCESINESGRQQRGIRWNLSQILVTPLNCAQVMSN